MELTHTSQHKIGETIAYHLLPGITTLWVASALQPTPTPTPVSRIGC